MATNTLLETHTANFSDLLGNRKIYRVPAYQRDYSWDLDNWQDLWDDIVKTHDKKSIHYMGAIVLQVSKDSDNITIIDGQQRFATLSILALAVIDKISKLVEAEIDPEKNNQRIEILKRTYIGDTDSVSLHYSSKLVLNANDGDFYQSYLVRARVPNSTRSLKKSEQLLWAAFSYFSKKLDSLPKVVKDGASLSEFLTNTVAQRLLFIQISVEDQVNAYVDDKFKQDFSVISISTKQNKKKKLVKYILSELERDALGRPADDNRCTIDHILPQHPTSVWRKEFNEDTIDDAVYRLGNMTPLEKSKNVSIDTEPYEVKREQYRESSYKITREIESDDWNELSIENRQKVMAERAACIWRVKY